MQIKALWLFFFNVFVASSIHPALAYGKAFELHSPSHWQITTEDVNRSVFDNTRSQSHEMVTTQVLPLQTGDSEILAQKNAQALTTNRRPYMRAFGLHNYTATKISQQNSKNPELGSYYVIESRFQDFKGADVQMIERQYVIQDRLFVVTYMVDAPAVNEPMHTEQVLDNFVPNPDSYMESAIRNLWPNAHASEVATSQAPPAPQTQEEIKRPDSSLASMASSCLSGIKDNLWELVKGTIDVLAKSKEYALNSEYRTQINATIGVVVAQFRKSPVEFSKQLATQVAAAAQKSVRDFFERLSPTEKARVVCKLSSDLLAAGLLGKILVRAPLAANEVKELENLTMSAIKASPQIAVSDSYFANPNSAKNVLEKVSQKFKDRGVETRVETFHPDEKAAAYQGFDEKGKPYLAFRKETAEAPERDAGLIAHEAAHTNNSLRLLSQQDLGTIRTIEFGSVGNLPLVKNQIYAKEMRIDEVHARAVQSSAQLNRAERVLNAGRQINARLLMKNASDTILEGQEMQSKSKDYLRDALSALRESRRSWNYEPETGALEVLVARSAPGPTAMPNSALAGPQSGTLTVKIRVGKQLDPAAAQKRADRLFQAAMDDLSRFDKTFEFNLKKLKKLKEQYDSMPAINLKIEAAE